MGKYIFLLFCFGCTFSHYDPKHLLPYNFMQENAVLKLSKELNEISGICFKDSNFLFGIQDEVGKIYEIDAKFGDNKVIIDFESKGDFEGIAYHSPYFYVLKSNGDIYEVEEDGNYNKFTFPGNKGFDFEGIAVHPDKESLIVSCKRHKTKSKNDYVWLYSFSLKTKSYMKKAYMKYPKKELHDKFHASGISFDKKGNLYLISAKSYTLAQFDKENNLKETLQLPSSRYQQVEGICFAPNGTLYISSEKKDQKNAKLVALKQHEE